MQSAIHSEVMTIVEQMANGNAMVSADDLEEFLCTVSGESDEHLCDALNFIKYEHPGLHISSLKAFGSIAYFFEDSSITDLKRFAKRAIIKNKKNCIIDSLLADNNGDLEGIQLSNDKGTFFCVFTREAYKEGGFRFTRFNETGFFGHSTRKSYEDCLKDAVESGFRNIVVGILDDMASNPALFS